MFVLYIVTEKRYRCDSVAGTTEIGSQRKIVIQRLGRDAVQTHAPTNAELGTHPDLAYQGLHHR